MFCKLSIVVVLIHSIMIADILTDEQHSFISKSISFTTLIGETVEFNCSEYNMESQKSTAQLIWYKNEEPLRNIIKKNPKRTFLDASSDTLTIRNVTNEDAGTYKCVTSNQSHSDISTYTLTVNDLPELKPYYVYTSNITITAYESVFIRCMGYMYHDSKNYKNQNHLYFKDEKPLFLNESDKRMSVENRFDFKIRNISYKDNGTYKCVSSNKFRIDYAVTYLNVVETSYDHSHVYFYDEIVSQTKHLSEHFLLLLEDGKSCFKNHTPIKSSEENTHIKFNNSTNEYEIKNLTIEDAGNYTCNYSDLFETYNLHYSLNIIDRPEKLYFRLFNSNISLIIGKTFQLKCHIFQSTENYTTWYSWKKNGEKLELNNNIKNMNFEKNQSILMLSNLTSNESGIYECEAESYYHKVYSAYALTIPDKNNYNKQVYPILSYPTYIVALIVVGSVTILCCICWLRRKKTTGKESKANKSQCLNDNLEEWNADLNKEENVYDHIYEVINSPLNRSSVSGENSGLCLENSIEEQVYALPCDNIAEKMNSPLNRSTMSGENSGLPLENFEQAENHDGIEMEQTFHKLRLFNQGKNEVKKFMIKQNNNLG